MADSIDDWIKRSQELEVPRIETTDPPAIPWPGLLTEDQASVIGDVLRRVRADDGSLHHIQRGLIRVGTTRDGVSRAAAWKDLERDSYVYLGRPPPHGVTQTPLPPAEIPAGWEIGWRLAHSEFQPAWDADDESSTKLHWEVFVSESGLVVGDGPVRMGGLRSWRGGNGSDRRRIVTGEEILERVTGARARADLQQEDARKEAERLAFAARRPHYLRNCALVFLGALFLVGAVLVVLVSVVLDVL